MSISKILIVDDNEADQFYVSEIINQYNPEIQIAEAHDGEEALELIEKGDFSPDVILLDINMPGMDGFGFLEAYDVQGSKAVVVMLSSSDDMRDREKCESYDCVKAYLAKPLHEDNIGRLEELV